MNVVVTGSFDKTIKYWSRIAAIAATAADAVLLLGAVCFPIDLSAH